MTRTQRAIGAAATIYLIALTGFAGRAQQATQVAKPLVQPNPSPPPAPAQPVPFSHRIHAGGGLPCQMCHTNPEPGVQMTFPTATTCMTCHRNVAIAADRPTILRLAAMAESNQPIPWVRVYQVLPGVTWAHRKHVQAGVNCETCHGEVSRLDAMAKVTSVTAMASCIGCHEASRASTACETCHAWPAGSSR